MFEIDFEWKENWKRSKTLPPSHNHVAKGSDHTIQIVEYNFDVWNGRLLTEQHWLGFSWFKSLYIAIQHTPKTYIISKLDPT